MIINHAGPFAGGRTWGKRSSHRKAESIPDELGVGRDADLGAGYPMLLRPFCFWL